jgi:hypothetical protein
METRERNKTKEERKKKKIYIQTGKKGRAVYVI